MKKSSFTALVSTTPFSRASFAKLPGLLGDLGPVKAPSVRIASRCANALRAGYPAHSWNDLADSRLLLVSAPAERLEPLVNEMLTALRSWKRRAVVLVDCGPDSRALDVLARRGAEVASLHLIGDPIDPLVLLEGDSFALREIRRRLEPRPLIIRKGASALAHAAAAQICLALPPLFDAAMQALRQAGLNPVEARRVLETLVSLALRSYRKSGRRSWKGPRSRRDHAALLNHLDALRAIDPAAAVFLRNVLAEAFRRFGRNAASLSAAG
jgi:hypothetical protein